MLYLTHLTIVPCIHHSSTPEKYIWGSSNTHMLSSLTFMGSQLFRFLIPVSTPNFQNRNRNFSSKFNYKGCYNWHVNPNHRSRFRDAYVTDEYVDDDEFRFRNTAKQRVWWSDDLYEDDDDEEFGFELSSISFGWIIKVFRAFGWIIPAVVMSLLLGTGPNTIIMTLALPLAQSAFSLVTDTLWGRSIESERRRPKSRSKRRPFARTRKENSTKTQGKESGGYKSWVSANNEKGTSKNFGGWDELDDHQMRVVNEWVKKENEPRVEKKVKISWRMEENMPLFLRMLIATFPFLGFWMKLL